MGKWMCVIKETSVIDIYMGGKMSGLIYGLNNEIREEKPGNKNSFSYSIFSSYLFQPKQKPEF